MESAQLILPRTSDFKCHVVARLIARHITTGEECLFIYPIFTQFGFQWMLESSVHALYINPEVVINMALSGWPRKRLDRFNVWPIFRLLERLEVTEQLDVLEILRRWYGFSSNPRIF